MFEIFISKLIDKDIRYDIEAFIRQKLLSIDKSIVIRVIEGNEECVLYKFDDQGHKLSDELIQLIETAKDLLKVKITGRTCYRKFKAECIKNGVSIDE